MSTSTLDPHDPGEFDDYVIDWATFLAGDSETSFVSSTWGASVPSGLTVSSTTSSSALAIIWVTGGMPGTTYGLTNRITTPSGRTQKRTIFIPCRYL